MTVYRDHRGNIVNTHERLILGPDDIAYNVTYSIESYGHPGNGWDDPGDPAEIALWEVEGPTSPLNLKEPSAEEQRIIDALEERIALVVYTEGPEDYYDE